MNSKMINKIDTWCLFTCKGCEQDTRDIYDSYMYEYMDVVIDIATKVKENYFGGEQDGICA